MSFSDEKLLGAPLGLVGDGTAFLSCRGGTPGTRRKMTTRRGDT